MYVCIWKAKLSIILCYTLNGFMLFKRIQYLPSVIDCVGWTWIITRVQSFVATIFPSFMCSSFDHHSNNLCLFWFHLCTFFCHHSIQTLWSIWSSFDSVSFIHSLVLICPPLVQCSRKSSLSSKWNQLTTGYGDQSKGLQSSFIVIEFIINWFEYCRFLIYREELISV